MGLLSIPVLFLIFIAAFVVIGFLMWRSDTSEDDETRQESSRLEEAEAVKKAAKDDDQKRAS